MMTAACTMNIRPVTHTNHSMMSATHTMNLKPLTHVTILAFVLRSSFFSVWSDPAKISVEKICGFCL